MRVVFEDQDILIVEKPPGIVTADPARAAGATSAARPSARVGKTLFDLVKRHVRQNSSRRRPRGEIERQRDSRDGDDGGYESSGGGSAGGRDGRLWIIHRLDKEASGLLVFAKSERAYEGLKTAFATKDVHRVYLAVAEGVIGPPGFRATRESLIFEDRGPPAAAPSRAKLARRGQDRPAKARPQGDERENSDEAGRRLAITHYRVIASGHDRTLVEVMLDTGRKNQIRIHMQELGHPLVGDARFGARTDPLSRLGLHAAELGFEHPGTHKPVRFESPAPAGFYKAVGTSPSARASREESDVQGGTATPAQISNHPASLGAAPTTRPRTAAGPSAGDTSWNNVAEWYDQLLEDKGNDHYEQVIIPATLGLLNVTPGQRVLDLACGQGIIARRLSASGAKVTGIDAAPRLIDAAKARSPELDFREGDARELAPLGLRDFDSACCVMALGNIDPLEPVFEGVSRALKPGGVFVAIIAHPAFRNPGSSDWGWDDVVKRQYRRVDAYLSPARRAIDMRPGKAAPTTHEDQTWSFHRPIGVYVRALADAGFVVDRLAELVSKRAASSGPRAPEENRARLEFPLFLAIRARSSITPTPTIASARPASGPARSTKQGQRRD